MPDRILLIAAALVTLGLLACGGTAAQVNDSGHQPYLDANYPAALDAYRGAQDRAPESAQPFYNAGNVLYRMEEYEEAIQEYDESIGLAKNELRAQGFFNRGNASFQKQKFAQAVDAYKEVLRMNPDDEDAKHNLEMALLQNPPEPQDDQDEDDQEDEPQDEQEQDQGEEDQDDQNDQEEEQEQPVTAAQARQLLESVGQAAQTLQERRGQVLVSPKPPSEFDW